MRMPLWLSCLPLSGGQRQPTGEVFYPLTSQDLLEARREALTQARQAEELPLWSNACLVARGVRRGRRRYPSGRAVLRALTPAQVEELAARWSRWDRQRQPGWDQFDRLKDSLAKAPWQRLRWKVLRTFGALPTEARARAMTRGDYLWCAANLLLDGEEKLDRLCPQCRSRAETPHCPVCGRETTPTEQGENPAFDWARFRTLREKEGRET